MIALELGMFVSAEEEAIVEESLVYWGQDKLYFWLFIIEKWVENGCVKLERVQQGQLYKFIQETNINHVINVLNVSTGLDVKCTSKDMEVMELRVEVSECELTFLIYAEWKNVFLFSHFLYQVLSILQVYAPVSIDLFFFLPTNSNTVAVLIGLLASKGLLENGVDVLDKSPLRFHFC